MVVVSSTVIGAITSSMTGFCSSSSGKTFPDCLPVSLLT